MTSKRTIALVEDNEDDLFFMKRAMKSADIDNPLQVLSNGKLALDYLKGAGDYADRLLHPLPILMLLDLKLPDMSGFEVLRWIKSKEGIPVLPTIVLTTSGESRDIEKAYELGANSFLVKPSGSVQLLDMVIALKQYWFSHNSFPRYSK